jgi:4-hydroxy-3-methylbut-2-enyl diphosphate reductase
MVEIDPGAGFCFGVERVIETAESLLNRGETVYGLGEMVHNQGEVERLKGLGLKTVTHAQIPSLSGGSLLLRAHGEPPLTYSLAATRPVKVIDGTCPIVHGLQKKIRKCYASMDRAREQLVIFGKSDHPETIGLLGQVGGDAVVVSSVEDAFRVEPGKGIYLFSQTTMDPDQFKEVEEALKERLRGKGVTMFRSDCTICGQMKKRKPGLSSFTRDHEVMVFVSGKNSSNGRMLYNFCRSINPATHWISEPGELDPGWFRDTGSVGISGATSTSREQLERVAEAVKKLIFS